MNTVAKHQLSSRFLFVITLAVGLIVVVMPVHAFVSTWLGTAIGPLLLWKSWKELLLLLLVPVVAGYCVLRPDVARTIWRRPVNKLIALYVALHLALSVSSTASSAAVIAGLMMNLRFLAIFILGQLIAEEHPIYLERVKMWVPRWLLWTVAALGAMAILQVFVLPKDFLVAFGYNVQTTIAPYILVDQNPHAIRAFATLRGPNTFGAYLLLPLAVALYSLYVRRRDWLALGAVGLGFVALFLTDSRSAWLGFGLTVVVFAMMIVPRLWLKRWVKAAVLPAVLAIGAIGWGAANIPAVRLAVFHSSPGDSSLSEGSTQKHWEATYQGIVDVVRHPWGSGVGSAGPASFYNTSGPKLSENYFVQIAQEVGILGLGLFVAINILTVASIVRHKRDVMTVSLLASFAGLCLVSIFLHGWADDPTALTWWALAGLYIGRK